jgi:hypothetical protein
MTLPTTLPAILEVLRNASLQRLRPRSRMPPSNVIRFVIREALMLDKPEKTHELMATLEAALPFEVVLMPDLIAHLARQQETRHCQASP